jgi:hypothetical protein
MQKKRYQFHTLVVGLGLLIRNCTRLVRLGVSIIQFQKPAESLKGSVNDIALQSSAIQDQINSLVAVVLQNRRRLELTAEKRWAMPLPRRLFFHQ